jgi:hypothetical protein
MTYLSIIVIKGATVEAAAIPESASDANLSPRFLVFHFLVSIDKDARNFEVRVTAFAEASRIAGAGEHTPGV